MKCKELIHPFQNDPGVSQRQRVMDDLLNSSPKIDARNLADMLDYFQKVSKHINYYDAELNVSDWQPFFQNNLPFTITSILKFDKNKIKDKLDFYKNLFDKNPSKGSLQLLFSFIFYSIIRPINDWNIKLKDSELPIMLSLTKLIKDKLADSFKVFIVQHNTAVRWFKVQPLDFMGFLSNVDWNLDITDLYATKSNTAFLASGTNNRKRTIALMDEILPIADLFIDIIESVSQAAENSLEPSFMSLKEEFKEKLSPHLTLLFSFLKLFKYAQDDLNSFTKKHLDFFYKEVLFLKAKPANADQVHLVFEIQNQIQKYLLQKGLLTKDAKDANKREILFSIDDQIVVNKAKVLEKRTLFLNNKVHGQNNYLEGLYIAPNASMADGIDKPFSDDSNPSWPTLGSAISKYMDPENKFFKPHPQARVGFVLASPVLLLNEGERTIDIKLGCLVKNNCEESLNVIELYDDIKTIVNQTFYTINRDLIAIAVKKGISKSLQNKLNAVLSEDNINISNITCYNDIQKLLFEKTISEDEFFEIVNNSEDQKFLADIFKPIKALNVSFSGEKGWLIPRAPATISMTNIASDNTFEINIKVILSPDEEAIKNYNDDILKEGFDSVLPLLKIDFDDRIKLNKDIKSDNVDSCCLKTITDKNQLLSLYQFFRNITFSESKETKIDVRVCGLKNLIVQNSESLQNVNGPIYPFGTRPEIIDFDIKNPPQLNVDTNINLIGPDFYIGSQEVFSKKWNEIHINLNWKDKPTSFREYYKGYLKDGSGFGLDENKFFINLSILENGIWKPEKQHSNPNTSNVNILGEIYNDRKLFENDGLSSCTPLNPIEQTIHLKNSFFPLQQEFVVDKNILSKYDVNTSYGFLKINLQFQDFCHKIYSYVLARQMMALGKLPDSKLEDAIYYDGSGNLIVFSTNAIKGDLENAKDISNTVEYDVNNNPNGIKSKIGDIGAGPIADAEADDIRKTVFPPDFLYFANKDLSGRVITLRDKINLIRNIIDNNDKFQAVIPNEPWTPIIKNILIDYTATAPITDIEIIHLYPYAGTYKKEQLQQYPSLLPTYCDEGNLFLAIQDLEPGSNINILFQLAEATADSESKRENVSWHYLENNTWKSMRNGFEILDDGTDGLTTSGIIKFSVPANISSENTILPKGLHWLKAEIPKNSKSVSEIIGIHAQAIKATFTNDPLNDKLRLANALPAGSISKLKEADSSIKKVDQPYGSFNGKIPEDEGHFYIRVSELLKHKGRAIQKFDFERLVLEAFPEVFKVKCINHSFALDAHKYVNDLPMAPGYILMAVIPDLNKLKAAQVFEPRVPVSLLARIQDYIKERCSPFVRLRVMNPRYEGVNFCINVKLHKGNDENFFKEKLKQDLREYLAPWAVGQYDKLTFGQCIYQSDIVGFLESKEYVDYILDLRMQHEDEDNIIQSNQQTVVCPISPRSILIATNIDVKIEQEDCERWASPKEHEPCTNSPIPIENYCNKYNA